ncbi:deleted in malignant brain tumors 1 protein-like [Strongylocentrotus purpuratus]|uniref:SRCR domain-containing protein n=1 Tax=Strongylocentrotus purpuratus TaxID=7668 RepID=A0A7M7T3Q8_STRPU|nr:deleted in malignant brain tumors 1 protein-like [Strongylocentrotus purpuratus]
MLGFDGALDAPRSARFGQGSGRSLLKYVNCDGTEENVADCAHAGIGRYSDCSHTRDAGAVCFSGIHPKPFQVRLVGGSNDAEGRVEVLYDGSWETICDVGWDLRDARVVCRIAGFNGALDAPGSARFGQGSGRSLLTHVSCDGTEDNLADCANAGIGRYTCSHTRDAGAVCYSGEPFQVRLTNGTTDSEGRVKVLYKGSWGTICDDNWDLRDARVVCKMLEFDGALAAPGRATFGAGSGKILFDDVRCKGTEYALAECYHRGLGVNNCEHDRDADPFKVRLTDGAKDSEGRVEVMYDGSWGTVCDNGWDLNDARVVCRMLGFDGALAATFSARFGQGNGSILLDDVQCHGTENNIADCYHRGITVHNCNHASDSGAICFSGVRLIGGSNDAEGRVEILHDGSWGTVCDDSWDIKDAEVVCRMLGFDGAVEAPPDARFGKGSGSIFLDDVQCQGTETDIERCDHHGIDEHNCAHNEDASVICIQKERRLTRSSKGSTIIEPCQNQRFYTDEEQILAQQTRIGDNTHDYMDMTPTNKTASTNKDAHIYAYSLRVGNKDSDTLPQDNTATVSRAICHDETGVRLSNGSNNSKGGVEVLYGGSWHTICDRYWYLLQARMVCKMMRFDGALDAPRSARFGQGVGDTIGVDCYGTEENLADCPRIWTTSSCVHRWDAGAVCYLGAHPQPFKVRLVSGSNDAEGRIEVQYDGSWGTICDNDWWDLRDARVVCRMLGFDGALEAPGSARFDQDSGRILLVLVNCDGTEDNLADCAHAGIDRYLCSHTEDAGAFCYSGAHPNQFQVRLVGGSNDAEGRVEVVYDGSWGTICDDSWDLRDARVVCRMLGFDGALKAPGSARFGEGSGDILLDDVGCEGTEDNLADCAHSGIRVHSCRHDEDAGTICYSGTHPNPFQVHLVGGSNDAEGRVELMHDGSWGTICDVSWGLSDARVVCRMLGFDGALDAPRSARFGQGSGRILLVNIECEETEDNLADCAHLWIGNYCGHGRDAGAICYLGDARVVCRMLGFDGALDAPRSARFGQGSGRSLLKYVNCDGTEENVADCAHAGIGRYSECSHTRDAGAVCFSGIHPKPFQVRLVGGSNDAEGRVEVLYDGSWETICDVGWDLRDARVVCRIAGFNGALDAPGSARFGQGSGRSLLTHVSCDGTEDNLSDCANAGIGRYTCSHTRDAGAVCYSGEPFQVRLTNGTTDSEGRVKVLYKGSWGTICDDNWDLRDARVVCKMLEFDGALAAPGRATFGVGSGKILFDDVRCKGTEYALAECYHRGLGVNNCEHDRDADPFKVRLTDGAKDSEGRVEVMYDGSWGTVCDNGWDLNDARVVCRMLGFDGALAATFSARFGQGNGSILLDDVQCHGTESNIADCYHRGITVHNCNHASDSGAICFSGVRLIGGTYDAKGRVEILHDGSWGTVCDDSWDLKDAEVVCRMLSFEGALDAPPGARFGKGSGSIFLDEVQCQGTETDIERCDHDGIGVHNCAHNEDASVICIQKGLNQDRFVASTYQDLNAPPKLPERRLTRLSKGSAFIEPCQNQRLYTDEEQILAQQTRIGDNTHDYMDMTPMNKTASTNKDAHIYAYSLRVGNKDTDTLPQDNTATISRAICHDETECCGSTVPWTRHDRPGLVRVLVMFLVSVAREQKTVWRTVPAWFTLPVGITGMRAPCVTQEPIQIHFKFVLSVGQMMPKEE